MRLLIYNFQTQFYKSKHQPETDWQKITGLVDSDFNYNLTKFQLAFRGTDDVLTGSRIPISVRNLKVELCLGML